MARHEQASRLEAAAAGEFEAAEAAEAAEATRIAVHLPVQVMCELPV